LNVIILIKEQGCVNSDLKKTGFWGCRKLRKTIFHNIFTDDDTRKVFA